MIKELKTYILDFNSTPTKEDVEFCINKAKNEDCVVKLFWRTKWSGEYCRYIYPSSDIESVLNSLPKNMVYNFI